MSTAPRPRRTLALAAALSAAGVFTYACADTSRPTAPGAPTLGRGDVTSASASATDDGDARDLDAAGHWTGLHRRYGHAERVGQGRVRTYVLVDKRHGGAVPVEVGVAFDEHALDGLPAPMAAMAGMPHAGGPHDHAGATDFDLAMPAHHGTPYQFVMLNWNPAGHEPPGIYDIPHFDFHFYTASQATRDAIDPVALGEAQFLAKSANLPPEAERAPGFLALAAPGTPVTAVPRMGVHWVSLSAPELQGMLGNPTGYRPFTTTFIHGSWDGHFIFDEPMVTRAFILGRKDAATAAQRDSVIPLPAAAAYRPAGYYPAAYRITYDAQAHEYHVALTHLTRRD